jgi:maleate cis-trans isomerase
VTKIGLLIPAVNTVAEGEFQAGTSAEVTVHTAEVKVEGTSADYVRAMVTDSLPRAISDIARIRPGAGS